MIRGEAREASISIYILPLSRSLFQHYQIFCQLPGSLHLPRLHDCNCLLPSILFIYAISSITYNAIIIIITKTY